MYDGKVIIDTQLNNNGFIKGVKGLGSQLNGLKSVTGKLSKLIASAFAVRALVNFGKECVEQGSNVAEVQNVVDVAFGDMTDKVEEFASSAIQNFGMSRLSAKKTASTYMAMAKGMGIADATAADMSITLTGLTGDVASFYNISQELADTKLKSVFTGETETLKDLGVVMTQANLKTYALEQGITRSIESMTQAELVGLRYSFVLNQLAMANGDFSRTSDSWANQTRILSMQWQEFMSIVGQTLITVLTPLVKILNNIVSAMIAMANTFNSLISTLFGGANNQIQQTQSSVAAVGDEIESSVENQNALTDATTQTTKAQKKLLAGFDEINKLSGVSAGGTGTSGTAGGSAAVPALQTVSIEVDGDAQVGQLTTFLEGLQRAIQPTLDALSRLWDVLKMVGTFRGDALRDFYESFLVPVGSWVMGEGLPRFIDTISNGLTSVDWQTINDALHTLWDSLAPFATNVGEGLLWLWENVLVPLGTWTMNEVVPRFLGILADTLDILNAVIEDAAPAFQWLWDKFLKPLAKFTGGIIISLLDDFHGGLEIIAGLLTGDFSRAVEGAKKIVKALGDRFTYAKDLASLFWGYIREDLSGVGDWLSKNILDPVTGSFKSFLNGLISGVEGFVNFFVRGINKIIGAVNALSFDIPEALGGGTIGFNIPMVKEIQLPRLASGAVIPPNREFLAVLGDQKSGTNIETPLPLMIRAFKQAMAETGGGGRDPVTVVLEIDKREFGRVTFDAYNMESRRVGVKLAEVKA